MSNRLIEVVDYDPSWPALFAEITAPIRAALAGGPLTRIEHVGSTSVPGLPAKPVIDIDVVIPTRADLPDAIARLATLGYVHQGDLGITGREAFKSPPDLPRHNLYVCAEDSPELRRHLTFRDYLRAHPDDARHYGGLKRELAAHHATDIDAYVDGKTDFIKGVLENAGVGACMDEVEIADYEPRWPELFAAEAARLRPAFGPSSVALEHIGSTSVPGLAAKPVVDIQAVVRSLSDMEAVSPRIVALGWIQGIFAPDPERRLYFKKYDMNGIRTHQLHVYEAGHPVAAAHLLFRDYLRAHETEARRYEALKRDLAVPFRHDRLGYNEAKADYIKLVIAKAREQKHG